MKTHHRPTHATLLNTGLLLAAIACNAPSSVLTEQPIHAVVSTTATATAERTALEPTEGLLPLELLALELLPLELLPLELLPLGLLLPLELLCEALAPLEPRCASTGASRTKRIVVRTRESWRIWRIAVPFGAVRMRDGCLKH